MASARIIVLASDFRVHGRIRVVDASAFPGIPGYFIACAVAMTAEQEADKLPDDGHA